MVLNDESPRSKTIDRTLTQIWTKKGHTVKTAIPDAIENDTNVDIYEYSKRFDVNLVGRVERVMRGRVVSCPLRSLLVIYSVVVMS